MRFKRIVFENYKTYYGHQDINLTITEEDLEIGKNIILLGGLNGAGKTTILRAIRYILFGKRGISKDEYERLLANTINNTYFEDGGRDCSVSLTLEMDSGEEWTLKVQWRFDKQKKLAYENRQIYVKKAGASGSKKLNVTDLASFNRFIDRVIPYNAAPFFIFDGEEIKELITKQNSYEMKEAIHKITGLDSYKLLLGDLELLEKQLYKKLSSATNQFKIDSIQKELEDLEKHESTYERFIKKTNKELQAINAQIKVVTDTRNEKIASNSKSRESLVRKQTKIQTDLEYKKKRLEEEYRKSVLYMILRKNIAALKQEIKKEREIKQQRILRENSLEPYNNFINQLLGEDINPPLTSEQYEQIKTIGERIWLKYKNLEQSEDYEEIHDLTSREQSIINNLPLMTKDHLIKLNAEVIDLQNNYQEIETEIQSAPKSVNIEEETKRIAQLQEKKGELNSKVRVAFKKLTPIKEQITNTRNKVTRLSASGNTADDLQGKLDYVERSKKLAEEFLVKSTELKAQIIRDEFENMLKKLFRKTDEFGDIVFDIKNYSIRIYNEKGQEISILDRSAGEMQMISSALIWALIKSSDLHLPMVIDTPLGRLDSVHRNRLIEKYYKELSDQVIILSTDTEITTEYMDMMRNHSSKQYLLDYNEKDKYTLIRKGYFDIVKVK